MSQLTKNLSIFNPKIVTSVLGSGIRKKSSLIPDPRVKIAPFPGSATLAVSSFQTDLDSIISVDPESGSGFERAKISSFEVLVVLF